MTKIEKWRFGFRKDFMLGYFHEYYDGDIYALNLGWFWINYKPWGW